MGALATMGLWAIGIAIWGRLRPRKEESIKIIETWTGHRRGQA